MTYVQKVAKFMIILSYSAFLISMNTCFIRKDLWLKLFRAWIVLRLNMTNLIRRLFLFSRSSIIQKSTNVNMNEWMTVYPYSHNLNVQGRIDITFIKRLDPKIVLPHRCQILRLMNKTPPQSTMPTGSEQVVGPRDAPRNSPELCIERTFQCATYMGYRDRLYGL